MITLDSKHLRYNIVIVGCGATGSQLIPFVTQLCNNNKDKIRKIVFIDGDLFSKKNLQNQKCVESDVDRNKAKVLAERYNFIYPDLNIEYYDDYIKSWQTINDMIKYDTIVIGCVDNNRTRKILCEYFNKHSNDKLIYIDTGNGTDDRKGQIVIGYKDYENVILDCVGASFPDIYSSNENVEAIGTCMRVNNDNPQNIATNIYSAANVFNILTNIIMFDKIENHIIFFNADKLSVYSRG